MNQLLKVQSGNAKIGRETLIVNLPAGHSCPFASACKAWTLRGGGPVHSTAATLWSCYAAGEERYANVRDSRWHNFDLLKGQSQEFQTKLISNSLRVKKGGLDSWQRVRIHSSGDFFSPGYFRAWCETASKFPTKTFYAYTKAVKLWVTNSAWVPSNLILTASYGGTHDRLIEEHSLKYAKVVFSRAEAAELGLEIDHDDSHAWQDNRPFALLLHGTQKKGTPAAKALSALRASGEKGYSRK